MGSATALDVLHATTIALTSLAASSSRHSDEKSLTSSSLRGPYGVRALSPRYTVDSAGMRRTTSRRTVRPPTPESKKPIARLSLMLSRLLWRVAASRPGCDCLSLCPRCPHIAHQPLRDAPHVVADERVRPQLDERFAAVVRLGDKQSVAHHLVVCRSPYPLLERALGHAARRVGAVDQIADLVVREAGRN